MKKKMVLLAVGALLLVGGTSVYAAAVPGNQRPTQTNEYDDYPHCHQMDADGWMPQYLQHQRGRFNSFGPQFQMMHPY
ncbi:hypothetical protein [Fundicoccus culcitae]|uniref:Uncharacterized protein n=1 Tax=Fundicoccus culcitae TaxID=2969821 RepID=A0ABY5P872_9LACT|nr:hypothetical protein [Fundicoccus culcitae]UUX34947.1 hypothetical protein NRE15_04685 [Fundicoccus culcitae]